MHLRIIIFATAFFCLALTSCHPQPTHVVFRTPVVTTAPSTDFTPMASKWEYTKAAIPPQPSTTTTITQEVPVSTPVEQAAPPPETIVEAPPMEEVSHGSVEDAIQASFGDIYAQAWGVSGCESHHDPSAVSPGGGNWGLFQINTAHKGLVRSLGYSWDQILDPVVNAAVARSIYDSAGGWGPWSCRWAA